METKIDKNFNIRNDLLDKATQEVKKNTDKKNPTNVDGYSWLFGKMKAIDKLAYTKKVNLEVRIPGRPTITIPCTTIDNKNFDNKNEVDALGVTAEVKKILNQIIKENKGNVTDHSGKTIKLAEQDITSAKLEYVTKGTMEIQSTYNTNGNIGLGFSYMDDYIKSMIKTTYNVKEKYNPDPLNPVDHKKSAVEGMFGASDRVGLIAETYANVNMINFQRTNYTVNGNLGWNWNLFNNNVTFSPYATAGFYKDEFNERRQEVIMGGGMKLTFLDNVYTKINLTTNSVQSTYCLDITLGVKDFELSNYFSFFTFYDYINLRDASIKYTLNGLSKKNNGIADTTRYNVLDVNTAWKITENVDFNLGNKTTFHPKQSQSETTIGATLHW